MLTSRHSVNSFVSQEQSLFSRYRDIKLRYQFPAYASRVRWSFTCRISCSHLLTVNMSGNKKSDILYLFDRPAEPVYVPKGENQVAFQVPDNYLVSLILFGAFIPRINLNFTTVNLKLCSLFESFDYISKVNCTSDLSLVITCDIF